jgi:CRP-like cAMP-binding protein
MANLLIRRLENFTRLSDSDKRMLEGAVRGVRQFSPRQDIIREDDPPGGVHLVLEGFACRYKHLEDGRRQIMAYFLPGDFCDLHVFVLKRMDHNLGALTLCTVADIPRETILDLLSQPRIAQALWWATLVDEATLREWLVNLGQRTALERIANVLVELFVRLKAVGLTQGNRCELPVTQAELADSSGLSSVHVNRMVQQLRAEGLIQLRGRTLTILDPEGLKAAAMFNPNYLHLDHEGRDIDADLAAM